MIFFQNYASECDLVFPHFLWGASSERPVDSALSQIIFIWCKETIDFINVIGDRLIAESGDSKSKKFLFERISLAIQRGNAASIRGTFPDSALLSEIFAL
jgi:hypothetical protein